MLLDNDEHGAEGAQASKYLLEKHGVKVKILSQFSGLKDPGDILNLTGEKRKIAITYYNTIININKEAL